MFRKVCFLFCLIAASFALNGQTMKGKAVDHKGVGIEFANIYTQGGSSHSHTNEFGNFVLSGLMAGDTIVISHLGFQKQVIFVREVDFEQERVIELQDQLIELDQVVVTNSADVLNTLASVGLQTNPVNSSQEILRRVPGLIIGQHAGGGKAEQIFLRGFDIDHGTDINITVDGMPVNMVSHAHGQGYADLHFLIPETIERIDFGKGPYYAQKGNFATAGYVDFQTREKLDKSMINVQAGQFNTLRTLGLFDLLGDLKKQRAYIAAEYLISDGPFESPQNFSRLNIMSKYSVDLPNLDRLSIQASHFESNWDASGQIPQRAIDAGSIGRFGAIDDTEGGNTSRTNIAANHTKFIDPNTFVKSRAYFTSYDFELFSNFTFFLNDPVNGDQIRQKEDRNIIGIESVLHKASVLKNKDLDFQAGIGFRADKITDNELSRTLNRKEVLERASLGNVDESNFYGFMNATYKLGRFIVNPALRLDYFRFSYYDQLEPSYNRSTEDKTVLSPKLNVSYSPGPNWQLFLKSGIGFHSNDTRVVIAGENKDILPAAYGIDLGTNWKLTPRLILNSSLWYLMLEQELVYVGDEGIVEPSGRSRRLGMDFGMRYQPLDWLFLDADINYAHARSIDEQEGANFIPLAPGLSASGRLSIQHPSGWSGGFQYRYLDNRPANEDNSIVAEGYFVADLNLSFSTRNARFGISIENLFDTDWNETQFATESRLMNEASPVEEIHFTPGTPFQLRANIAYMF